MRWRIGVLAAAVAVGTLLYLLFRLPDGSGRRSASASRAPVSAPSSVVAARRWQPAAAVPTLPSASPQGAPFRVADWVGAPACDGLRVTFVSQDASEPVAVVETATDGAKVWVGPGDGVGENVVTFIGTNPASDRAAVWFRQRGVVCQATVAPGFEQDETVSFGPRPAVVTSAHAPREDAVESFLGPTVTGSSRPEEARRKAE